MAQEQRRGGGVVPPYTGLGADIPAGHGTGFRVAPPRKGGRAQGAPGSYPSGALAHLPRWRSKKLAISEKASRLSGADASR